MLKLQTFLILIVAAASASALVIEKSTADFISEHGYQVESIDVTTEDKYILGIFYMPPAAECTVLKNPVLIMHGHFSSSDMAVVVGPTDGLPFLLSDDCHPVYLGNARSNIYSQRHEVLSASSPKFWDFSYEQIGYYDIAAMVQYIRAQHPDFLVDYVGHSQGCAEVLVLLAERSEYRNFMGKLIFLAPGTFIRHVKAVAVKTLATALVCPPILDVNINYIERNLLTQLLFKVVCPTVPPACDVIYQLISGWTNQVNQTAFEAVLHNFPSGNSLKELRHILQGFCYHPNDFKHYDHGFLENLFHYGTFFPPPYELSGLAGNQILVYYGNNDTITVRQDVEQLIAELPNVEGHLIEDWGHLDFMLARNVLQKLNSILKVRLA